MSRTTRILFIIWAVIIAIQLGSIIYMSLEINNLKIDNQTTSQTSSPQVFIPYLQNPIPILQPTYSPQEATMQILQGGN